MKLHHLLLGAALIAACSDTTTPNAPGADAGPGGSSGSSGSSGGDGGVATGAFGVDAGKDIVVNAPSDTASLLAVATGSGSQGASFAWTQTAGAKTTLTGEATSALKVAGLVLGSYTFRVTATSVTRETATDDVTITVLPDLTLCKGATVYVSPSGKDTNDGSQAQPWATLAKATASTTTAGTTIQMAAGTYTETVQSELAPGVCLEGQGPNTIIKSTDTTDWKPIIHAWSVEGTDGHQHISNLKLDGQNLSSFWGIEVAGRKNVSIHDVIVVDFKDRGVIMTGRDDNKSEAPKVWATGLSFYNNTVLNSGGYNLPLGTYGRGCLNIGGTEGMLIFNNTITQNQRPVGYNGWPIKSANDGHNRGLKIYNNKITKIPFTGTYGGDGGWDFAVEMFWDQGTEFFNNTVDGGGFDTNFQLKGTYAYSVWVHDNTFSLPAMNASNTHAVTLEFDTDTAIVENNKIDKMASCILFTPRSGNTIQNVTIRGNVCTNVAKLGGNGSNASFINIGPGGDFFHVDGLYVYNNTFLSDPNNRPWWGIELGGASTGTTKNINIKNNIIAHTVSGAIVQGGNVVMDKVDISNNDIFDIEQTTDPVWTGTKPTNLTYANNLHVVPMFVSATDFHLQAGSPVIDKGVNVGLAFKGAAPDMGYAEH